MQNQTSSHSRYFNSRCTASDLPMLSSCPLRPARLSFYRWLHLFRCISSTKSKLYDWVVKAAAKVGVEEEFMDLFLLEHELAGEIAVACRCELPGAGVGYYAQLAVLNIPHRSVEELTSLLPSHVPKDIGWFHIIRSYAPALWTDPKAITELFVCEGHK